MKRNRRYLPDPTSRAQVLQARRRHTEQVVLTIVFTAVELWAVVAVVILLGDNKVLAAAASLALSAALMAVWETWRAVLMVGRALRAWLPEELPEEEVEPERPSNLVRL